MHRSLRRWWPAPAAVAILSLVSGCGWDSVETVAHHKALVRLGQHVAEAQTCLAALAGRLEPSAGVEGLRADVGDCGNTAFMNEDDATIASTRSIDAALNLIYSGHFVDGSAVLDVMSTGGGTARAGTAEARWSLVTCWRATVGPEAGSAPEFAAVACNEAVAAWIDPTEQLAFSDVKVPDEVPSAQTP